MRRCLPVLLALGLCAPVLAEAAPPKPSQVRYRALDKLIRKLSQRAQSKARVLATR